MKTLALVDWKKQLLILAASALVFGLAFVAMAEAQGTYSYSETRTYTYNESGPGYGPGGVMGGQPYPQIYPQSYPGGISDQTLGAAIGGGIANAAAKNHKGAWTVVGAAGGAAVGQAVIPHVRGFIDRTLGGLFGTSQPQPQYFHGPADRGPAPQPPQRDWRLCGTEFCPNR